jgi:hypothetical protein
MPYQLAVWIAQATIAQLTRWAFDTCRRLLRRLRRRRNRRR